MNFTRKQDGLYFGCTACGVRAAADVGGKHWRTTCAVQTAKAMSPGTPTVTHIVDYWDRQTSAAAADGSNVVGLVFSSP
jgi:hypothetical protein